MGIMEGLFQQQTMQAYYQALTGKRLAPREEEKNAAADDRNIMTGSAGDNSAAVLGAGVEAWVADESGRSASTNELLDLVRGIEAAANFVGGNKVATKVAEAIKMQLSGPGSGQVDPALVSSLQLEYQAAKDQEAEKLQQVGMQGAVAAAGLSILISGLNNVSESMFGYLQAPPTPAVAMERSQSRDIG